MVSPGACHILLLEDAPAIAALLESSLKRAGFCNVRSSSSIAGARQCWHAQLGKFDVVVTDFSLPDGCAPGFIEELVRYKPDLRVIVMSGFSEEDLELPQGVARHLVVLQKPFRPDELIETLGAGLSPSAMC